MIIQRLILKEYNWAITILFLCDCTNITEIINHLKSIDCPHSTIEEITYNLKTCNSNTGLTYSNYSIHRTIMIINKTDSPKELINTVTHECFHFIQHLKEACTIQSEEELATLTGRFNMNCWEVLLNIIK